MSDSDFSIFGDDPKPRQPQRAPQYRPDPPQPRPMPGPGAYAPNPQQRQTGPVVWQEPQPQDYGHPAKKPFPWQWVVIVGLVSFIAANYFVPMFFDDDGGGDRGRDRRSSSDSVRAGESFASDYLNGLADVYEDAADAVADGKFKDIADAQAYVTPRKDKLTNRAFRSIGEQLETINGDGWDENDPESVFRGIAKGLRQ